MNERINFLKEKVSKLPLSSGVYLMKDKAGKIIYIGKAKRLKNRVSSYFNNLESHSYKTEKLVEKICDFDFIATLKELDALVLESSLIKQHRPKYNILLKDARGFNYVKITPPLSDKKGYPRLIYTHSAEDKSAEYVGPYANGFTIRQSVLDANRIFALPSCSKKFPEEFNKTRPCLNYRIKRCMGVCLGNVSEDEYRKIVKSAIEYIKSGSKDSVKRLTAQMKEASQKLDFEKAARLRDQIAAIARVDSVQSVQSSKKTDYDIIALVSSADLNSYGAAVIRYRNGKLVDKENFYLGAERLTDEASQIREEFIIEYYSSDITIPKEIYLDIDMEIEDKELIEEYLKEKSGRKVSITVPKRGEGLAQVALARSNAQEFLALKTGRTAKELRSLEELSKLLGLSKFPEYIECYDISNIGENIKVGGMVAYRSGKPEKKNYRKFNIKEVAGLDDYACMREVIRRRFTRYLELKASDIGEASKKPDAFSILPDLILLDGGAGHVSAVKAELDELGIDANLFGLVKDTKHKTRAITAPKTSDNSENLNEIEIHSNRSVFTFLSNIQEEVHRFSVTFAREKHGKEAFALTLTNVQGIGKAKSALLLTRFKTKSALKEASIEELREVAKISEEKANELKKFIEENL